MTGRAAPYGSSFAAPDTRWRTRDIVVTAVIAVAFGVVFWAWDYVWGYTAPLFSSFAPGQYIGSGVWLMPAVVAPLIVRKPGAALFAELVAAIVSALLGNQWALDVVLSGLLQGAGAEIVFLAARYRRWTLLTALAAAAGSAIGEVIHDIPIYYPTIGVVLQGAIVVIAVVSAVAIAGLGSWWLVRALRRAGVLEGFPSDA
jgi:energy-coupling factor transport system substrate-specific component